MFNPFKKREYGWHMKATEKELALVNTLNDVKHGLKIVGAMILPFAPGLLISWRLLHWHGLALVAATIATGAAFIWLIVS